ncbi:hypothetical protein [Rhizobium giardinii]|uniref:hypothetical protein n=1 Tax=Rhizobium giardinii TaxID=56731 RepID=UPI0012B6255F|nr:hypothetical protein [Rhizobium giardinii]
MLIAEDATGELEKKEPAAPQGSSPPFLLQVEIKDNKIYIKGRLFFSEVMITIPCSRTPEITACRFHRVWFKRSRLSRSRSVGGLGPLLRKVALSHADRISAF